MSYLVNLSIQGKRAVVVGAGAVALRKAQGLLEAGARVTVVAPEACDGLLALAAEGRLELRLKPYDAGELKGAALVLAATDNEAVNASVSADCSRLGLLVNVSDRPALCTFTLPAVVRRGDLTLAVTTEGRCPAFARALREELEGRYGEAYGEALDLMGRLRDAMLSEGWESARIQKALAGLYADGIVAVIRSRDTEALAAFLRHRLGPDFPLPS
ncbi:MAG: precorrin-2 dehydrogenase/sirohydrochlorin ferrochelatase family protein [Acidobacteriota bacterium]